MCESESVCKRKRALKIEGEREWESKSIPGAVPTSGAAVRGPLRYDQECVRERARLREKARERQ